MSDQPKTVLMAESEVADGLKLALAFRKAELPHKLVAVRDGQECLDYLSGVEPYVDRALYPLPDLLLINLQMPRIDGFEVLGWLGAHPDLNQIPAVVLSSSADESDIEKSRLL